ncbi:MAG: phosphoribosylanthranilate isomerase, partial [Chitinophagales bacterium]
TLNYETIAAIQFPVQKVGVFVNETIKEVIRISTSYEMDVIQLHGDETVEYCENLKLLDFRIIKAFGIDERFDFSVLNEYEEVCDYFLFDTKSSTYGGTGQKFNWSLLNQYQLQKPVFLSGGLDIADIPSVYDLIKDIPVHALDFNSKLELEPGRKDVEKCSILIDTLRNRKK